MTPRTTLAAVDAGSNAIRVVIAEWTAAGLNRIEAERVPVRLGHGAFTRGVLDAATIDAAVAAFQHFRAAFEPIAGRVIVCDSGALSTPQMTRRPYKRVRRPIWPLDPDTQF